MDVSTLIGLIVGIIVFVWAMGAQGGSLSVEALLAFWNLPSILITFGGALTATIINYPLKQLMGVFKIVRKVFSEPDVNPLEIIPQIVELTKVARKEGLLALSEQVKKIEDDFMRRALQHVVDGRPSDFIQTMLETEVSFLIGRHKIGQEILVTLGTFTPAFGMIGTIIGLIQMLAKLEDQSTIASGMAIALLTTFYGAMASYFVFLPIAGKLKRRSEEEVLIKEVVIRGVLLLQSGAIPSAVEENLKAYLPAAMINEMQKEKEKQKAQEGKSPKPGVPGTKPGPVPPGQKPPQTPGARPQVPK